MDGPKVGVSFSAGEGHVAKNKGVVKKLKKQVLERINHC